MRITLFLLLILPFCCFIRRSVRIVVGGSRYLNANISAVTATTKAPPPATYKNATQTLARTRKNNNTPQITGNTSVSSRVFH